MLSSLHIKNFRGVNEISIEHLGQVNLLVGKNNVGKTTILEALSVYGSEPSNLSLVLRSILEMRDDQIRPGTDDMGTFLRIFHTGNIDEELYIGPIQPSQMGVTIQTGWAFLERAEDGISYKHERGNWFKAVKPTREIDPVLIVDRSGAQSVVEFNDRRFSPRRVKESVRRLSSFFLRSSGLTNEEMNFLWDSIALTSKEDQVVEALRLIDPGIDRITLIEGDDENARSRYSGRRDRSSTRFPFFRRKGASPEPIPLRNLGDGMTRLFELSLSLVSTENGQLLIDEVDSGLHYLALEDIWNFIFRLSRDLKVQVFATTHSADCIGAFSRAAEASDNEGMIIRLQREELDGKLYATPYDEAELNIITRHKIEVR